MIYRYPTARMLPAYSAMLACASFVQAQGPAGAGNPSRVPEPIVIAAPGQARDNAQAVAVSPDGRLVAAAFGGPSNNRFPLEPRGGGVAIWDAATGDRKHFVGEYGDIIRLEFSLDARVLIWARVYTPGDSIDDDDVVVLDVATGKVRRRWRAQVFAALPRGRLLVGRMYDSCHVHDLEKIQDAGQPIDLLKRPRCLAVSPDGTTLAALTAVEEPLIRRDGTVSPDAKQLWWKGLGLFDAATQAEKRRGQNEQLITCGALAVAPAGKLVASGHGEGVVRLWDGSSLAESRVLRLDTPHDVYPRFAPDGQALAVLTQPASPATPRASNVAPQPAQAATDCQLLFYDARTWDVIRRWRFEDGAFRTWYARSSISKLNPERNPARLAFTPDGKAVLVGCNGTVLVETATGKVIRQFKMD